MPLQPPPRLRCAGVATVTTGLSGAAARVLTEQVDTSVAGADEALVQVCVVALLACTGWGWTATCAVVVEAWRGASSPPRGVPGFLGRVVLLACGAVLAGGLAAPAHSSDHAADPDRGLTGLPMPERALGPGHAAHPVHPLHPPDAEVFLVGPGDSLWLITARDLPPGASAAAITAGWHRLYRTNRAVIGPDPDLIHPGQLLRRPPVPSS